MHACMCTPHHTPGYARVQPRPLSDPQGATCPLPRTRVALPGQVLSVTGCRLVLSPVLHWCSSTRLRPQDEPPQPTTPEIGVLRVEQQDVWVLTFGGFADEQDVVAKVRGAWVAGECPCMPDTLAGTFARLHEDYLTP